jgi:cytochrome c-type biogenesis protein CcmF
MTAEIGHFALALALALALVQAFWPLAGAAQGRADWMALARPAAYAQGAALLLAYGCLTAAFIQRDFSVQLVAEHSNTRLPLVYRITAVWGNHEGSILLWCLILAGWTTAVAWRSKGLDAETRARVLGVMGLVSVGFLLFTLFTSNPFARLGTPPAEGLDLNPLLQDPGMVLHPPLLYMGYVGLVVAFAFAIAALLAGRLDTAWARWSRPWTGVAWSFLTLGIALGSFWAYYELGWGGWWFWDPVENASFMPWLVATALMHSLAVTEKRGAFKAWTVLLAIAAFSLSLLGTFIVRSGVLSSVHAFATDATRGLFILVLLACVVGGSLALFAWRAPGAARAPGFGPVSREAMLLVNNLLLLVATAAVMLGTLYPLVVDALGMGKLSVGPPYFNAVFVPLMVPALLLMGVGPLTRWHSDRLIDLGLQLRGVAMLALGAAVLLPVWLGHLSPMFALGIGLSAWIGFGTAWQLMQRLRQHPAAGWWARARAQSGSYYGMLLAHLGIAVFIAGVTMVSALQTERDVRLAPGEHIELAGHRFTLSTLEAVRGPNHRALQATVDVTRDGAPVTTLRPQRRVYDASGSTMSEVAIHRRPSGDLYVALGEPLGDGSWGLRVHHKPLVNAIWFGCLLMAAGGLLAVASRRHRVVAVRAAAPLPAAAGAVPLAVAAVAPDPTIARPLPPLGST